MLDGTHQKISMFWDLPLSPWIQNNTKCMSILEKGTRAFCSGGDQALRSSDGYADFENFGRLNVLDLQVLSLMNIS